MDYQTLYEWVLFPAIIFIARTCDVSLGTIRNIMVSKGKKKIAPLIGFFEVLLWLIAISSTLKNLTNIMCYLGWAGGYSTGIYVGLRIEEKLALGTQVMRIIVGKPDITLFIEELKKNNYGITIVDGMGARGPVKMIFTIVDRKKVKHVIEIMQRMEPEAFYSIEDVKDASNSGYNLKSQNYISKFFPSK